MGEISSFGWPIPLREKRRNAGQSATLRAQKDSVLLRRRNLMMAQGHLIMAPISKLPHQHQSGSYLEELHDLRLCRPPWIKPFITRWHFCPALNVCTPWESDKASETWWVMDNLRLCKGWQTVRGGGGERARGRLWPPSHASRCAWQMPPPQHGPRSLAPLTWGGRQPAEEKSPAADGATYFGWPTQALCPCHMSLTLVFWLKHFKTGLFSYG